MLQRVEANMRQGEESARIGNGEADVRDCVARQVLRAKGEELCGPNAENDALIPGGRGGGRD